MDTENLKYFCGLALSGKFNKVVKAKDHKSTQCSTLSEFGLETSLIGLLISQWLRQGERPNLITM